LVQIRERLPATDMNNLLRPHFPVSATPQVTEFQYVRKS
jgi:hypothetical protein